MGWDGIWKGRKRGDKGVGGSGSRSQGSALGRLVWDWIKFFRWRYQVNAYRSGLPEVWRERGLGVRSDKVRTWLGSSGR